MNLSHKTNDFINYAGLIQHRIFLRKKLKPFLTNKQCVQCCNSLEKSTTSLFDLACSVVVNNVQKETERILKVYFPHPITEFLLHHALKKKNSNFIGLVVQNWKQKEFRLSKYVTPGSINSIASMINEAYDVCNFEELQYYSNVVLYHLKKSLEITNVQILNLSGFVMSTAAYGMIEEISKYNNSFRLKIVCHYDLNEDTKKLLTTPGIFYENPPSNLTLEITSLRISGEFNLLKDVDILKDCGKNLQKLAISEYDISIADKLATYLCFHNLVGFSCNAALSQKAALNLICQISDKMMKLRYLDISGRVLGSRRSFPWTYLFNSVKAPLERLFLPMGKLDRNDLQSLKNASFLKHLHELDLSFNHFVNFPGIFIKILEKLNNLIILTLCGCSFADEEFESLFLDVSHSENSTKHKICLKQASEILASQNLKLLIVTLNSEDADLTLPDYEKIYRQTFHEANPSNKDLVLCLDNGSKTTYMLNSHLHRV